MGKFKNVALEKIELKENFRLRESETDVASLMATIKSEGLLNPVTVKKIGDDNYELLAGFRRYTAVKKLGHMEIAVNIVAANANSVIINQIENLQRQDTSTYEIGRGITVLKEEYSMSDDEVATRLGIKLSAVKQALDLFSDIPKEYRALVKRLPNGCGGRNGMIPNSVAASIVALKKQGLINTAQTKKLFSEVKKDGTISTTQIKNIGKKLKSGEITDASSLIRVAKNVVKVQVAFKMKTSDLKKINRDYEGGFHDAVREVVSDYFGVTFVGK